MACHLRSEGEAEEPRGDFVPLPRMVSFTSWTWDNVNQGVESQLINWTLLSQGVIDPPFSSSLSSPAQEEAAITASPVLAAVFPLTADLN